MDPGQLCYQTAALLSKRETNIKIGEQEYFSHCCFLHLQRVFWERDKSSKKLPSPHPLCYTKWEELWGKSPVLWDSWHSLELVRCELPKIHCGEKAGTPASHMAYLRQLTASGYLTATQHKSTSLAAAPGQLGHWNYRVIYSHMPMLIASGIYHPQLAPFWQMISAVW